MNSKDKCVACLNSEVEICEISRWEEKGANTSAGMIRRGMGGETVNQMTDAVGTAADLSSTETAGPAAKRVAVGHATALAGLTLQLVMQFAGASEGTFIANVCKNWGISYESTFEDQITTHRAAGMMSMQRLRWIWLDWHRSPPNEVFIIGKYRRKRDSSWYVGKYAPRSVLEAAILDESLAITSRQLMQGVAASGRVTLFDDLWKDHVLTEVTGVHLKNGPACV